MKVRVALILALVVALMAPLVAGAQPALHHVGHSYIYPDPLTSADGVAVARTSWRSVQMAAWGRW